MKTLSYPKTSKNKGLVEKVAIFEMSHSAKKQRGDPLGKLKFFGKSRTFKKWHTRFLLSRKHDWGDPSDHFANLCDFCRIFGFWILASTVLKIKRDYYSDFSSCFVLFHKAPTKSAIFSCRFWMTIFLMFEMFTTSGFKDQNQIWLLFPESATT